METGVRWTFRDILRGKSANILLIDGTVLLLASIVLAFLAGGEDVGSAGVLGVLKDVLTLKAENFARDLCELIVVLIPLMLVLWLPVALVLLLVYNLRDRNMLRTPENLYRHEVEASRGWSWPWSVMVGSFDFTAAFALFIVVRSYFDNAFNVEARDAITILATIACLIFAERRVRNASRKKSAMLKGNHLTVCAVLDGLLDGQIPEDKRNDLGRAKVATVIYLGICRTPEVAAALVAGIDLRTKVKLFSGFLNSAIHGILCGLSFGIAATLANELGDVGGKFAAGKSEELVDGLREPGTVKPHFFIEAVAVIVCVCYTTLEVFLYMVQ